jgi:2-dehydro-3-deoxy-D-arabinonate dehydratase
VYLTRHQVAGGSRWAMDGRVLPDDFGLRRLLDLPSATLPSFLRGIVRTDLTASGPLLAPVDPFTEVWAAGVTYLRSREAREAESTVSDLYSRVYEAERPELFFKAVGWRVSGHAMPIRIRRDSSWNVPEPELTLVINARGEIVGFCAGNDVSSRDIEGANPLYLPQAKIYDGACALGPGISLCEADTLSNLSIELTVTRNGHAIFASETRTSRIKRPLRELVDYLRRELDFPNGVFLMTGTGIVPPDDFSLAGGDHVRITIGDLTLENEVAR